jgi:hypothetical protein
MAEYMIIKIATADGRVVSVEDETGKPAEPVEQSYVADLYQKFPLKYVGFVCHYDFNPKCVLKNIGGSWVKVCK